MTCVDRARRLGSSSTTFSVTKKSEVSSIESPQPQVDMSHRLLDNSRIRQLADWTTRVLVNSRTRQLADANGDFACLVFRFLAIPETASCPVRDFTSPRDVQSASWRIRELSSYHPADHFSNIVADREFSTGCYLFTVSNSGLLSMQRLLPSPTHS